VRIYNGTYTINSPTGVYRTFKIRTVGKRSKMKEGTRIISIKEGHGYVGFGFVNEKNIFVWNKMKDSFHTACADMIVDFSENPSGNKWVARGVEFLLSKRCKVCNKKLTTPESVESGIGPVCGRRV